jgi:hypothetical protein
MASPAPATATAPPPPPDRFVTQLQKIQQQSAAGVYLPDLLKAQSGGKDDMPRKVKLAIRREFFTLKQYIGGVIFGTGLGALVLAILALATGAMSFGFLGDGWQIKLGAFLTAFCAMSLTAVVETRRNQTCSATNKHVDEDKRGHECILNDDCTNGNMVFSGMCSHPTAKLAPFRMACTIAAGLLGVGLLIAGGTSKTSATPHGKDMYMPIVLGYGSGIVFGYIFS